MNILNKYIEVLNSRLKSVLCNERNEFFCLTYQIEKDGSIYNYCNETKVVFDDKFDNYIYYRLQNCTNENVLGFGNSDILQINASLKMLIHSKKDITSKVFYATNEPLNAIERDLSNSVLFVVQNINTDKEQIYFQEIGEKSGRYNTKNHLFEIDLNLTININTDCLCQ